MQTFQKKKNSKKKQFLSVHSMTSHLFVSSSPLVQNNFIFKIKINTLKTICKNCNEKEKNLALDYPPLSVIKYDQVSF